MKLIVGLGNPGKKYERTRHNLGFAVIDALVQKWNVSPHVEKKLLSLVFYQHKLDVVLARPQIFMNRSGIAVKRLVNFYNVDPPDLWVVHDDLDLPLGKIKIRKGGGPGGHKGIDSIIRELGTTDFVRFRLGIGHPGPGSSDKEVEGYVLSPFGRGEKDETRKMVKKTVEAIKIALEKGIEQAMNRINQ